MIGVLSIDFDYFIDASSQERDLYFPNVNDEIHNYKVQAIWRESYLKHPELKKVGVIKDFYYLKESLMGLRIAK